MYLLFVKAQYPDRDVLFWPDLASAHQARQTREPLEEARVPVLARDMNLPCTPQIRSMEDRWGIIKQEVYKEGWQASSDNQLNRKIQQVILQVNPDVPRKMMERVSARIRLVANKGLMSQIH